MNEACSLYPAGHSMETADDAIHEDDFRLANGLTGEALTIRYRRTDDTQISDLL